MKKLGNYMLVLFFLAFIFIICFAVYLTPDRAVSFNENRSLAQKPAISLNAISNGEFTDQFETYFTDQFFERDIWIRLYQRYQLLTNQTFIHNYYINHDGWIYPKPMNYFAQENIDRSIQYMNELSDYTMDKGIELFFFSLPERGNLIDIPFPDYVSQGYEKTSKDYLLNGFAKNHLKVTNLEEYFHTQFTQEELKQLYYQTDHHWNINGAFEGYQIIYNTLNSESSHFNEPPFNKANYEEICYSDKNFLGSYNKQLYSLVDTKDEPCQIIPKHVDYNDFQVYLGPVSPGSELSWNQIYGKDLAATIQNIEYSGIFTGDFRELTIVNPNKEKEQTKVLFVKDSYGNPLTMWLSQHFYETTFYDMRYNPDRTLYEYIEENDFDMIAFLYNDLTFFSSMYDFKGAER